MRPACLCGTACTLRHRLATGTPAFIPTQDQREALFVFFAVNHDVSRAYLFHDGRVIGEDEYAARMTSRAAQLVAIATDGFPVLVSRRSFGERTIADLKRVAYGKVGDSS